MTDLELLKVVDYAFREYKDDKLGNKFGLMEYYSLTDLDPNELAKLARRHDKVSLSNSLLKFDNAFSWLKLEAPMNERLRLYHAVAGHELTPEDKLTICDKLKSEGYPLMDGIYNYAARIYVTQGVDAISKEVISDKIIKFYNKRHSVKIDKSQSEKVLVK